MKKLLALMVIFSLTAVVSATPIWTLSYNEATQMITVNISGNQGSLYIGLGIDSGSLDGFAKGVNAPVDSQMVDNNTNLGIDGLFGTGEVWTMVHMAGVPTYVDGAWLVAHVNPIVPATVKAFEYIEATGEFVERGSVFIPEPATMALLALGGLLFRRK